jgi:hypothetical protein
MAAWTAYRYEPFAWDVPTVRQQWARLHAGDAQPLLEEPKVLAAWVLFHNGQFQQAFEAGLADGSAGITVANKAQATYANYLEPSEKVRHMMFLEVAERAARAAAQNPKDFNAHYWMAYALGRYGQSISVAKALAQGLGTKVKEALETTIALQPRHADAHIALGTFHAEVIDKVGKLLAGTQGADAATGLKMFEQGLKLNPASAIARVEYAKGLVMLEGESRTQDVERLYAEAAAFEPADAKERLDVEMAKAELED